MEVFDSSSFITDLDNNDLVMRMISFLLIALLISVILSVELKNLYHAVICLGLAGIILGLIFFSLHANLIGIFQMAVYGGISIVLIFLITMVGEKHE